MKLCYIIATLTATLCVSSLSAADLELVFTKKRLTSTYVDRLGEVYIDGAFFSHVRERATRTDVQTKAAIGDGTWLLHLTKNGNIMTGEFKHSEQSHPGVNLLTDINPVDDSLNVGLLLTRNVDGTPPSDSSLLFKFFEKLGVNAESIVSARSTSWIDGRVVKLSAFPIFQPNSDKSNRSNLINEKFTPGLVIENIENFKWATQSTGIVSFFLPRGVASMRFEYVTKSFPKVDPTNMSATAPRHETSDPTQMKFKLNSFEPFGEFQSVKETGPAADFIVAQRTNSTAGVAPTNTELKISNNGVEVNPKFGTTVRVTLANGMVELWKFNTEWRLFQSFDGYNYHRWFYREKHDGRLTYKEGRNDLALTPGDEPLSIQRVNISYFLPFPRTEWHQADRNLTLKCKSPISQVVFSNEDLQFSPVQVDPRNFLISWEAEGFRINAENSEGFYIELYTENLPIPEATFKLEERANAVRNSPPKPKELEAANGSAVTPAMGNTTLVTLSDGTKELWKFGTKWEIERVIEPNHLALSRKISTRQLETGDKEEITEYVFAGKSSADFKISRQNSKRGVAPTTAELGEQASPAKGNTALVILRDGTPELWKFDTNWKFDSFAVIPYKVSPFENVNDGQNGYVVVNLPNGISSARVEFKQKTGLK